MLEKKDPFFKQLFASEALSGLLLLLATIAAIFVANSHFSSIYQAILHFNISLQIIHLHLSFDLLSVINDGLMSLFFLAMGLEIKRELLVGKLSSLRTALFPLFAAIGGMVLPGLFFFCANFYSPKTISGWAIPTATDIAFCIGILSLLSNRISHQMKIFLLSIAIIDDIGAIFIIAIFYSTEIHLHYLFSAIGLMILLLLSNYIGLRTYFIYLVLGLVLWLTILLSGIHATIAGVLFAFTIPHHANHQQSLLENWHNKLLVITNFFILPVFAFFNAGILLSNFQVSTFLQPLSLGIMLGLLLGKPLGVLTGSFLAIKLRLVELSDQMDFFGLIGLALLCGIGFTMSLFITDLAFTTTAKYIDISRMAIFLSSIIAGIAGYLWLRVVRG
jgi:NhaA family Na+:H+ antiporter